MYIYKFEKNLEKNLKKFRKNSKKIVVVDGGGRIHTHARGFRKIYCYATQTEIL